ncbi:MAG TPA: hypothetical protein VGJ95_16880 [Pseudonocardiaceae bacterium]
MRLRLTGAGGVSAELHGATVCEELDEHAVDTVVAGLVLRVPPGQPCLRCGATH